MNDLSILIPLYNEQEILIPNLRRLLLFMQRRGLNAEILLGSNGSDDSTVSIGTALQAENPGLIRFFHLERRGCVGRVFKIAVEIASTPVLIALDADLSVDLEFISKALCVLQDHDIALGSKQAGYQSRSVLRLLGSHLFIFCAQKLLSLEYDDYSIGAKGYRVEVAKLLAPDVSEDTNYVLDLLCKAQRKGFKIATVPIACADWRISRFRLLREGLIRFLHLFRLCIINFKKDIAKHSGGITSHSGW